MAVEIERKFLLRNDDWRPQVRGSAVIRQGYFCRTPLLRARIRIYGDKGFITLKSEPGTRSRHEFEYEIPQADAAEIIRRFSIEPLVTKTRHDVDHAGLRWAVDVFTGPNHGLVLAEVELEHEDQPVPLPDWVGEEVTGDRRYGNSNLARFPFASWGEELLPADVL